MSLNKIRAEQLVQAVNVFLDHAYKEGTVPANRQKFVNLSPQRPVDDMLKELAVEKLPPRLGNDPGGYALRVGNRWYPHMKLTIQVYGAEPGYVFGVDTHDMFNLPANAPDFAEVQILKQKNQQLGREIERAWEEAGLPTQNGLLRQYLNDPEKQLPLGSE